MLEGHPEGIDALVMTLIDAGFGNLAGPPSLESCTRDVYDAGTRFDERQLLTIALGIASAAGHLHRRGIMHGDLYGHNILHRSDGAALLGDFGAASFHAPDAPHAVPLQRLEVRAFGVLLEELVSRCDVPAAAHSAAPTMRLNALNALAMACLQDDAAARPLFGAIEQRLLSLNAESLNAQSLNTGGLNEESLNTKPRARH
jgi:serine/threonine protein kinase